MNEKTYRKIRAVVALFIAFIVSVATTRDSYLLAVVGVLTGMLFLGIARTKAKIVIDERENTVRAKASQTAYAIFAPTIGLGSFFLFMLARGEFLYLESLGMVLAYLTLYLIALYALSYHYFNRKFGGSSE